MGTRRPGAEKVYAAAESWVERALRSDDSLFTPGRRIWTSEWLDELHRRFLDRPDVSGDSFLDKLDPQPPRSPHIREGSKSPAGRGPWRVHGRGTPKAKRSRRRQPPTSAAQLAANTKRIKLGSGAVMLPKHYRA